MTIVYMKIRYVLIFVSIFLGIFAVCEQWALVSAQDLSDIVFPVAELGNCESKQDCEIYCDKPENMEPCLDFAEAHNLIKQNEIQMGRKMLELGKTSGPGGCQGQAECEAYCDGVGHIVECIEFAEKHGLIPANELGEAKKVAAAVEKGIQPPNCSNKTNCDIYCSKPENMQECMIFAQAAGLIPPDELEETKMMLKAIEKGAVPPNCNGKQECDIYCEQPEHFEECLSFAEAAGFMKPEEVEMMRRTGGKGPGGCRGEQECEAFCENPDHSEECMKFALEYGFMTPEEAEQTKKMMDAGFTTGPGGCESEQECEAFCQNPDNMKECIDFSAAMGEMTPEQAEKALKGGPGGCRTQAECEAFCQNPDNIKECIHATVEMGDMSEQEAQEIFKMMEQGEQIMKQDQPMMKQQPGEIMMPRSEDMMRPQEMPMQEMPDQEMMPTPEMLEQMQHEIEHKIQQEIMREMIQPPEQIQEIKEIMEQEIMEQIMPKPEQIQQELQQEFMGPIQEMIEQAAPLQEMIPQAPVEEFKPIQELMPTEEAPILEPILQSPQSFLETFDLLLAGFIALFDF